MKGNFKKLSLALLGATVLLAGCNNSTTTEVTYDADSWKEIIAEDCVTFFDGCNQCSRVEGEEDAVCTKMACPEYSEPRCTDGEEENTEVVYDENSWKEIIAEDCINFFDGCNNCVRLEGEEGAACTRMYCETYEEPRCTDGEAEEVEEATIDEEWSEENGEVLDGTAEDEMMVEVEAEEVSE